MHGHRRSGYNEKRKDKQYEKKVRHGIALKCRLNSDQVNKQNLSMRTPRRTLSIVEHAGIAENTS